MLTEYTKLLSIFHLILSQKTGNGSMRAVRMLSVDCICSGISEYQMQFSTHYMYSFIGVSQ